jgi:hypothetical protein
LHLSQVADCLDCEVLSGQERLDIDVERSFAADLMSDVLAFAPHGALLLTSLSTAQSVHTAEIADMRGIVLVCKKRPTDEVIAFAQRRGLPLLLTPLTMFEACGRLYELGLRSPLAGTPPPRPLG